MQHALARDGIGYCSIAPGEKEALGGQWAGGQMWVLSGVLGMLPERHNSILAGERCQHLTQKGELGFAGELHGWKEGEARDILIP